jgi:hypothetical protein
MDEECAVIWHLEDLRTFRKTALHNCGRQLGEKFVFHMAGNFYYDVGIL